MDGTAVGEGAMDEGVMGEGVMGRDMDAGRQYGRRQVVPLTQEDAPGGVIARLRTVVASIPDAVAVADDSREVTFAALAAEAAAVRVAIAGRLAGRDGPPAPVAVLFPHSARAVSTIVGVIASGHPVVVLDVRTPAARLARLAGRTGAALCVCDASLTSVADELGVDVLPADRIPAASACELFREPADPAAPAALAFTSGSTGIPKVVTNDQRMLVADAWGNSFATGCYDADDVIAHTLPMAFHAGLMVTIAGLAVGATMRLYDARVRGIGGFAEWLESAGATIVHTSPAILRAFVGVRPRPAQLAGLRCLTIAGEAAHGRDVEGLRRLLPTSCVIRNRYGSSETGLICEYVIDGQHPELTGPLPVGTPVGTTRIELVPDAATDDGDPELTSADGVGLVAVTRDFLASGYWADEAATAAVFTDNGDGTTTFTSRDIGRVDGEGLHLLGRRDHSVKVRGYLVEPAEVDSALFALPEVKDAVTVGLPRGDTGQYRLVSYVASAAERPSAAAIRAALRRVLPGRLVPESVVFLAELPRTERGKLDRAALPAPAPLDLGEDPKDEWERLVAQLWAEVLDLEEVGRAADFFELGGDSLAAEELTSRVVTDLGVRADRVSSTMLAESPTLLAYSRRLKRTPDPRRPTLSELRSGGAKAPLFLVAGGGGLGVGFVPVVRHLPEDRPVWALQSHALERRGIPDWSLPAAARRNVASLKEIQPQGPYHIAGHSYGGLVALEMAQQLRAAGDEVAILIELDSFPPDPRLQPQPEPRTPGRYVRSLLGLAVTGLVPVPGHQQYWRFHEQSRVLAARYRTAPYPGRTLIVVAESEEKIERSQWGPHLTGPWELVETAGDHVTMLRDPYARQVARVIAEALEALEALDAVPAEPAPTIDLRRYAANHPEQVPLPGRAGGVAPTTLDA